MGNTRKLKICVMPRDRRVAKRRSLTRKRGMYPFLNYLDLLSFLWVLDSALKI